MTVFLGVAINLFSLMLGTVIFSFLRGLKIKSFVLSESVINFSSLFMTQDFSEGHLLPNNELVSSAK